MRSKNDKRNVERGDNDAQAASIDCCSFGKNFSLGVENLIFRSLAGIMGSAGEIRFLTLIKVCFPVCA
jgi:hypothetical protein